jgi:diguanylate cyclase (GGDEF)-like protein
MVLDSAAGGVLVLGAAACAASAVLRRRNRPVALLLGAALGCAAAHELGGADWLSSAACLLAASGLGAVVIVRCGPPLAMSWLDAAMGAAIGAALPAAAGANAPGALAAAGVVGGLALGRWRVSPAQIGVATGVAALGIDGSAAMLAAPLFAAAAWVPEEQGQPGPDFSAVVLTSLLAFAATALGLLIAGQFADLPWPVPVLATVTVLTGMARAGLTVTERLRASHRQAITDDLTGLGNRRHLLERLESAIAEGGEVALLLIDLDGFKELNDTLGHEAGDEVLRQIGPRLAESLRDGGTLARLGGDEFAVVLAPGDEATASASGLRLRAALERSFGVGGMRVHVDGSIGIALFPEHGDDALALLQRADVAMYEAKRTRTGHEVYLPERDHHSRRRLELLGELRDGLEAGQLVLHYQPKAEIATGAVRGVEALVRWAHPRRGLLPPSDFLPLAEHTGLGRALTAFVVDRALEEIGGLRNGFDLTVAVNLGPADLLDLGLPSEIDRMLRRRRFEPEHLRLEVSEDVIMADPERTLEVLAGLRAIGVGTALDDFGAGHASLGHLKALEVDELKIDRSFVIGLPEDERDVAIIYATVELARRLGMRVVAEGVESSEGWDTLARLLCDEAQGFYLSRPLTASALGGWLRERALT